VCEVMTATIPRSAPAVGTASVAAGRGIAVLRRWWPPVLSGLLMAVIGLVGATRPVLSWDEIATADVAQRSLPQIWHLAQHVDGVLAPYYVVMHFWTALVGDSVLDLRLPSIVAMAVAVAAAADRTVAAIIHDRQHPGDVIVYEGGRTMRAGVGYYLRHVAGAAPGRPGVRVGCGSWTAHRGRVSRSIRAVDCGRPGMACRLRPSGRPVDRP
jgi:hypothetical protein